MQQIFSINYNDCEKAVGPMFAAQSAIKCFANDTTKSISERCNAMILYDSIGTIDTTIDELIHWSPSACSFILKCLNDYKNNLPTNSNFVMNFGYAVSSLKYQLEHNSSLLQQQMIEEEMKKEQKEMDDFINDFVLKEFNRNKSRSINFDEVRERAINLYYDRKLI